MTILVVDDEPSDVEAARGALESAGFQVLEADSYGSALKVFAKNADEMHGALLDISLPGRNGIELAQELLKRNPKLGILFVSGHVGAEVIRFYGLRVTDRHFLKKPFQPAELISRLEAILNSSEPLRLADFGSMETKSGDGDRPTG